jgi:hypothetical protein
MQEPQLPSFDLVDCVDFHTMLDNGFQEDLKTENEELILNSEFFLHFHKFEFSIIFSDFF